ncbi:hypothetical protein CR203_21035 [Salipaludibacillus neizhouensis]|uniref:Uncharacterized protein n=1 Tax=Salipaludibacillus neizhouensis TaxID=885475 RepID=A0A3A9K715_9BACI|nr:hypothetical protein CR203_21035 [Salipaludibacillus neizhouensis]
MLILSAVKTILESNFILIFQWIKKFNRNIVRAITTPVNKVFDCLSYKDGINVETGVKHVDGVSVFFYYDGVNQDRVLIVKKID